MNTFALWVFSPALQGRIPPAVSSVVRNLLHFVRKPDFDNGKIGAETELMKEMKEQI